MAERPCRCSRLVRRHPAAGEAPHAEGHHLACRRALVGVGGRRRALVVERYLIRYQVRPVIQYVVWPVVQPVVQSVVQPVVHPVRKSGADVSLPIHPSHKLANLARAQAPRNRMTWSLTSSGFSRCRKWPAPSTTTSSEPGAMKSVTGPMMSRPMQPSAAPCK